MNVPSWYVLVLLSLASWRTWRLLAEDDIPIFDRFRRYITRLGDKWQEEGDPVPDGYRVRLGKFIDCVYCFGFWISMGWWGAWQVYPQGVEVAAAALSITTLLILNEKVAS